MENDMKKIEELKAEEVTQVAGGGIIDDLMDRFPNGEWVGGTFYPNGRPNLPAQTTPVIF